MNLTPKQVETKLRQLGPWGMGSHLDASDDDIRPIPLLFLVVNTKRGEACKK